MQMESGHGMKLQMMHTSQHLKHDCKEVEDAQQLLRTDHPLWRIFLFFLQHSWLDFYLKALQFDAVP